MGENVRSETDPDNGDGGEAGGDTRNFGTLKYQIWD